MIESNLLYKTHLFTVRVSLNRSVFDAETVEAFAGVPEYPLYKRLALSLLKSIASGCFCGCFEKVSLGKEVSWLKEKEDEWRKMIIQKGSELVNVSLIVIRVINAY